MSDNPHDSEIGRWLESQGFGQYGAQFFEHGISLEVLPELTDADLRECGVALLGHRKQLLAAIREQSTTAPAKSAEASVVEEPSAPASTQLGHFELLEELGRGGIGIVYRAWDTSLNRQVAIKLLDPKVAAEDPQFLQDFIREAQTAASINHPHIVQIYFAGEDNGQYYLATELLEGQSMGDRLERGPMDEKLVGQIAREITEALAATNARRLIHGDITPQNIFLTASGDAKLLDFGLARKRNVSGSKNGEIIGSIYYLSPERAQGGTEDFRSDMFSLGATLFHALTGLPAFDGDDVATMLRQRVELDGPRLRSAKLNASAKLDRMIARMMARHPADRYPSYEALLADLDKVESEEPAGFDPMKKSAFSLPPPAFQVAAATPKASTGPRVAAAAHAVPHTVAHLPLPVPGQVSAGAAKHKMLARIAASKFLMISILVHVLFGIGATVFIVQRIQAKRKVTFQGGPPTVNASKRALEHKMAMAQKKKTGGAPPQAKRIVSAGLSSVSLPDMPNIPNATTVVPGMMSGMGGAGFGTGMGFGSGMGSGMGGGTGTGGGGLTMFGVRGGSAGLIGTFYDLKQTRDRKPTDMAGGPQGLVLDSPQAMKYKEVVHRFARSWSTAGLANYFTAPGKLSTQQLFIPQLLADEAPKAFQVEKEVQASRWLVHYTGEIIAPKDGKFRFVGSGDDTLIVRCKGRNVLDASIGMYAADPGANDGDNVGPAPVTPMRGGKWIEARKGEVMKMEVLIGENPGGHFSCFLMVEESGVDHPGGTFPVFQLKAMDVPNGVAPGHHGAVVFGSRAAGGSLLDSLRR